jgi:hypothetical protein
MAIFFLRARIFFSHETITRFHSEKLKNCNFQILPTFLVEDCRVKLFQVKPVFFLYSKILQQIFFFLNIALRTHPTHLLFVKMHPISPKLWYISPQVWFRSKKDKKIHWKTGGFFQTGNKIINYMSTCRHWDCTTLQHSCTAFGFTSGYTEVLQGGTISMPTST